MGERGVMIPFEPQDKARLLNMLTALPGLDEHRARRAVFVRAGLQDLLSQVYLDGPSKVAIPLIVNHLINYGKVAGGQEALGLLLQTIKDDVGEDDRQFLEKILAQYQLLG